MVFIPAGYGRHDPVDPVIPGVEYIVTKQAIDFTGTHPTATDVTDQQYKVMTNNWADILVFLILTRSKVENRMALLQYWYGKERIKEALKHKKMQVAAGGGMAGGSVAGAVIGGVVGGKVGAITGLIASPAGVPFGAAAGVIIGALVGSMVVGGTTAGVTAGVEAVKKGKEEKQGEAKK